MLLPGAGMFEAALGACNVLTDDTFTTAPALTRVSIPAALQLPVPEVRSSPFVNNCKRLQCITCRFLRRPARRAWQLLAP